MYRKVIFRFAEADAVLKKLQNPDQKTQESDSGVIDFVCMCSLHALD
jgi:hypothetical protein